MCFLHFLNVTLNHNNSRQILLVCNSLVHSFKDLESLEWYADINGRYSAFSKELSVLRQEMQKGYTPSKKAVVIIINDFHELAGFLGLSDATITSGAASHRTEGLSAILDGTLSGAPTWMRVAILRRV